jgi:hypothetical protein
MGRTKLQLSNEELNQLKNEMYCSACAKSYFKDGTGRGRMSQFLEAHFKTNKHKVNSERYYADLEKMDSSSKLDIDEKNPFDDDNLTSI